MATYNLTGAGTIGLSSEVSRLIINVTAFASNRTIGRATPANYYDLGLLRFGVQGAFGPTIAIDATTMFLDAPEGVTTLGYSLFGTTAVTVTEQFGSFAPGGTHVPSMESTATIPNDGAFHTLLTYTVPSGNSALLEYFWASAGIGQTTNAVTFNVTLMGLTFYYNAIQGPINSSTQGTFFEIGRGAPMIRMNPGEQLVVEAETQGPTTSMQVFVAAIIMQYPQLMW